MKSPYILLFCILFSAGLNAQIKDKLSMKDQQAIEHFKNYKKKNYKRFEGNIVATDSEVQFINKTFYYEKSDIITGLILKEGLVYPQLLTDFQMQKFMDESTDKTQKRFLKLQKDPRAGFDVNNVSIKVSEVSFLGSDPKIKRFKLISKDRRISASLTYFIELTNKEATEKTSMENFIKGAKLTHIYQAEID